MPKEENFVCLFVAHHLLGDGRAILGIMVEFADVFVAGKKRKMVQERLIESINDLPKGSDLSFISRLVVDCANKNWAKEKQTVSYGDYLKFEREFLHTNPVAYTEETVTKEEVDQIRKRCKEQGVSVNDYLVAKMMVEERTNKVVIAADIRNDLSCYNENALGNYATGFGVVVKNKETDVWITASAVSKKIKKIRSNPRNSMIVLACYFRMNPELIDAVAISTFGGVKSKVGRFVGSKMFGFETRNGYSVTNLGNIINAHMEDGMLIPPASPANKKTMGVLSVNGQMNKCTAIYQ